MKVIFKSFLKILILIGCVNFCMSFTTSDNTNESSVEKNVSSKPDRKKKKIKAPELPEGVSCINTSDELIFIAANESNDIMIFDADSSHSVGVFKGHSNPVEAIAISTGKKWAASVDEKGLEVLIWDYENLELIKSFPCSILTTSVAFNPGSEELALGDTSGAISVINVSDGNLIKRLSISKESISEILTEPPDKIKQLMYSPYGRYLAAYETGGSIIIWDLNEEESANIHIVPPYQLWQFQFSNDGKYLMAAGGKYSISMTMSGGSFQATVKNVGGVIFLKDLQDDKTYSASTDQMIIDNAYFLGNGEDIIIQASVPPNDGGLKKRLYTCPIESIIKEDLSDMKFAKEFGNGPIRQSSAYCEQESIYVIIIKKKLITWPIQVDE